MKPGRKLYSRILACALTAGFIASSAAVNVSAAEVKPTDIRATIIPSFSPTIAPLPSYYIPVPTVEPSVTILPTIFPTAFIPGPTVTPIIPSLEPTSGIPVPTVDPTIEPVPTSVTAVPTVAPPSLTPPTASPAAPAAAESFDVNGDGAVNTSDLLKLIKIVIDPPAAKPAVADLNGDGNVNSADVLEMKKLLMK